MKSAQQIIPAFAIAVYLAIFVGGRVLHQHHCNASATECCEDSSESSSTPVIGDCHPASAHKHSHDDVANTLPTNHQLPNDRSADCWTCETLAQSGSYSPEIALVPNTQFICFIADDYEDWQLQSHSPNYLVRGPPEAFWAAS